MADLEADTLYYRADHPLGFLFSAGNPEPDPQEGWVAASKDIAPLPERKFECSTLEAYEGLLRSERRAAAITGANAITLAQQLASAVTVIQRQAATIHALEAEFTDLQQPANEA